ncbi:replication protein A OB domain containing protein [Nitzschia inconspicua]|uniref:Replication protein A OB domain containing protein n=1 Tax=Nitzschia inconspicua TaxID=303405 RepID=A0A9K3KHI8_9STRA|nr:replication protein A OB domain containing protein [Nitzschia inconspicua]
MFAARSTVDISSNSLGTSMNWVVHTWSNAKGEGSLFSIGLLDSSGMDIRATMFKEAVDKFYNYFEVGEVYTISGGRLKVASINFNTCRSGYELTLDQNSEIHLVDDTDQELLKCDLTLVDDIGVQVRLTLWGKLAQEARGTVGGNKMVAVRLTRVSDYGDKSLSGGDIHIERRIPETEELHEWWTTQGSSGGSLRSLSSSGGAGGKMDSFLDHKTISDINGQNLGFP